MGRRTGGGVGEKLTRGCDLRNMLKLAGLGCFRLGRTARGQAPLVRCLCCAVAAPVSGCWRREADGRAYAGGR